MAAAPTSERRHGAAAVALALLGCLLAVPVRADSDVYVQQEDTPIVSRPGVGGKILAWVDSGFPLTVVGRDGDWLKVSSSFLDLPPGSLWVPAARVGTRAPGAVDIAYAPDSLAGTNEGAVFHLEVQGSEAVRVRVHCRIDEGEVRKDTFRTIIDDVPVSLDVDGEAVDCIVRKLRSSGRIDAVLQGEDGTVIAAAGTAARRGAVRVRSEGPWGAAIGVVLPARFVAFRDSTESDVPIGNPVPPLANPVMPLGNPVPPLGNPVPSPSP